MLKLQICFMFQNCW